MKLSELKIVILGLGILVSVPRAIQSEEKHVHDQGEARILVEGKNLRFEFTSAAHPIYGFEREPKGKLEQKRRDEAVEKFKASALQILGIQGRFGCSVKSSNIDPLKRDHDDHGHDAHAHGNVVAEFEIECSEALEGKKSSFNIASIFPKLKLVELSVARVGKGNSDLKTRAYRVKSKGVEIEF